MTDVNANAPAGAVTVSKPPIVVLRDRLEARISELDAALPDDISPRQFVRAVMTSASLNADILACSWQSVWNSCLKACRDGLLPDGVEGALVPYKSTANWIPMYQGLLRRFRRSGQFKWVTANVVHEGEKFEHYVDETGEHFKHVPSDNSLAPVVRTYACALTSDGGFFVTVIPPAEMDKIQKMSRAQRDDAPWKLWPDEMRKKSALRRLSKFLPSARDLIASDDEDEFEAPPLDLPRATLEAPASATRPQGAAAALDQFAGSSDQQSSPPSSTGNSPDVGEADRQQAAASAADDAARNVADAPGAPAADEIPQAILQAYERGKKAKADGHMRKALPPEYRDAEHQRQAIAWQAGFDGNPMPQWR